eukprot:7949-Heterococcus_DN1.PRE.4
MTATRSDALPLFQNHKTGLSSITAITVLEPTGRILTKAVVTYYGVEHRIESRKQSAHALSVKVQQSCFDSCAQQGTVLSQLEASTLASTSHCVVSFELMLLRSIYYARESNSVSSRNTRNERMPGRLSCQHLSRRWSCRFKSQGHAVAR